MNSLVHHVNSSFTDVCFKRENVYLSILLQQTRQGSALKSLNDKKTTQKRRRRNDSMMTTRFVDVSFVGVVSCFLFCFNNSTIFKHHRQEKLSIHSPRLDVNITISKIMSIFEKSLPFTVFFTVSLSLPSITCMKSKTFRVHSPFGTFRVKVTQFFSTSDSF